MTVNMVSFSFVQELYHTEQDIVGLIRYGMVAHGFIDGHSRLITGLRMSNNNKGETVLALFLEAAQVYGVPSRLRGDHGVENLKVAAWMDTHRGANRGSYIWGRSVASLLRDANWTDKESLST